MFEEPGEVKLVDTDAAGVMFFANHLKLAHNAYEAFMTSIGFGLNRILRDTPFLLPVVHVEADYKAPLRLGDRFRISLSATVKDRSFLLTALFKGPSGEIAAEITTVHLPVDKKTGKRLSLPDELKRGLESIS